MLLIRALVNFTRYRTRLLKQKIVAILWPQSQKELASGRETESKLQQPRKPALRQMLLQLAASSKMNKRQADRLVDCGDGVLGICYDNDVFFAALTIRQHEEEKLVDSWEVKENTCHHAVLKASVDECEILLCLHADNATQLAYELTLSGTKDVVVRSCALTFLAEGDVRSIDAYGRKRHKSEGSSLWLGEGMMIWNISKQYEIQLSPGVGSSVMLDEEALPTLLFEHEDTHPSFSFPYRQDGSAIPSFDGAIRLEHTQHYSAAMQKQLKNTPIVRPWLHRNGTQATFIWTEHACHTSTEAHRTVYFGRSDIADPKQSVGGFYKYRLPITKSIHASNRNHVSNAGQSTAYPGPMASLEDASFKAFVVQLAQHAPEVELCLHCADPSPSTPDQTKDALEQLRAIAGGSCTWIDHIWLKPSCDVAGCKEAFVCEGANADSEACMIALWNAEGVRYFWNPVYEYNCTWKQSVSAKQNGEAFYRMAADIERRGYIAPQFWKSTLGGKQVWNWATYATEQVGGTSADWQNAYSVRAYKQFMEAHGLYFCHAYPSYAGDANCFLVHQEGVATLASELNEVLKDMARYHQRNEIHFCTVRDFFAYWEAMQQLNITRLDERCWCINNPSGTAIEGATFSVHDAKGYQCIVIDIAARGKALLKHDANEWRWEDHEA